MAPIHEDGLHRFSGYRGTVLVVIVQVAGGEFVPRGDGSNLGTTYRNYYLDDLHIADNGAFEVILSRTRPRDTTATGLLVAYPVPPRLCRGPECSNRVPAAEAHRRRR